MKIYHLLTNETRLQPISGDRINEINFLLALSEFAEVYYNNQLFRPEQEDFGLKDIPIEIPKKKYDLYIVRNNFEVFKELPNPKIWVSYPYHKEAFEVADAVTTFNEAWKKGLEEFHTNKNSYDFFCGAFPKDMVQPKYIINIKQVLHDEFKVIEDSFLKFRYKARFGYGFTIGFFGRIVDQTLPNDYLSIIDELKQEIPDLNTVFAGSIRIPLVEKSIINVNNIPFDEMPYATSACNIVLGNEQPEANWAGSAKPLEAMGCGVPITVTKRPARVDQLGEDYPLYYNSTEELKNLILKLYSDKKFYTKVSQTIVKKAKDYYVKNLAVYLEKEFNKFLSSIS